MRRPTLETQRLLLYPMQADDLDDLLLVFSDPKVMAAFNEPPFGRPQMERWLKRNLDHQLEYGYGLFSLVHKEDGVLIGNCGLEQLEPGIAELGYDLRSDYWNRGLATEAAEAVRDYAWYRLRLPTLISLIRAGNHASRRVAEKIGMVHQESFSRHQILYWKYGFSL